MASLRLGAAFLVLALLAFGRTALAADAFAVTGIDVDITAANVAAAKEQALVQAERAGFRRLLERLTMPADYNRLPNADALQYVRDVGIEQERSSAVRYIATLTVRYNPTAVKRLLREAGLKYAEPRPRPLVVVPLFRGSGTGRWTLWDDPNPWRAAWTAQGPGALVPLAVPAGDSEDMTALPTDRAMAQDSAALTALGVRYRSSEVLVAQAVVNAAGTAVDVTLGGVPGVLRPFESKSYPVGESGVDAALRAACADIAQGLDAGYKQQNLLSFDRVATMAAVASLRGMEDWLAIRDRLGRVPLVRRWEVVSLSRSEAALVLHTVGETEQIRATLANAGLVLDWGDGFWTMKVK